MKSITFFICLTLIYSVKLIISEDCMTPTQVAGTCIDIKNCPPLRALLRKGDAKTADFATKFICHFEGKNPIVCCPGKPGMTMRQNVYGPLLPPQCGFANVSHTKIVGGMPAKLNAWPWMAALGYKSTPDSRVQWKCGGSLISARHVLTAAHCAVRNDLSIIRLGDLNLKRDDEGAHPIDLRFEKKIIHPEFEQKRTNDIAIIRLERDIQFTYNIHPICLPVGRIRHLNFVNTNPFFAGWGRLYSNEPTSDDLMEVQVPVITTEACAKAYPASNIDNSLICTGGVGERKGSCKGDSGGPIMLPINGSYYELGVMSKSYGCALIRYPMVNTRVTSYLTFIISNLK